MSRTSHADRGSDGPSWSRRWWCAAVFVGAWLATLVPAWAKPELLVVRASTPFDIRAIAPFQKFVEGMADVTLEITPSPASECLVALLEGRADMAMISTPLEQARARLAGTTAVAAASRLVAHPIASFKVAFAVHPSNPVQRATLEQIRRILVGETSNWLALGGPDLPIRVAYVSQTGVVTPAVLGRLMPGRLIAANDAMPMSTPEQVVKVVAQEPGALGIAQAGLVTQRHLPSLQTDEVIEQELVLVTAGAPGSAGQRIIDAARLIARKRQAVTQ